MEQIIELAQYVGTGAAWGMLWLGGFGLFNKSLTNEKLFKLVTTVFLIAAGFFAVMFCKDFYSSYSAASESGKEAILAPFKGGSTLPNIGKICIILSPVLLLFKPLKASRIVMTIIAISYVAFPYYEKLIHYVTH